MKGIVLGLMVFLGVVFLVGCASPTPTPTPTPSPTATPTPPPAVVSAVSAGIGTTTVAGNAFLPRSITVPVGSKVTWTVASDEAHTITFPAQGAPPPGGPPPAWPATAKPGDAVTVDGTAFVNTGIVLKGTTLNVTFAKAGTYAYLCAIHPGMTAEVKVVEKGQPYTSAAQAANTAKSEGDAILAMVSGLRTEANVPAGQTKQADGSTLWSVRIGAMKAAPTGDLEIYEYFPAQLTVKAGDTVKWTAATPHTVTFLSGQTLPPGPPDQAPAVKPSDKYDGKSIYNSGLLAAGPGAPADFQLIFPNKGSFSYLCLLHGPIGHVGTVVVE